MNAGCISTAPGRASAENYLCYCCVLRSVKMCLLVARNATMFEGRGVDKVWRPFLIQSAGRSVPRAAQWRLDGVEKLTATVVHNDRNR
jgi:hypothetical protein